ncbi:MAG: hypothetical protein V2I54_11250 [Bacteroidales bacterium]|nr:hypothetical protein [Bacteroidales bacterium]
MKKILAMMLMMASVLFFACSDDDDDTLTPEQAKAELEQVSTDMSNYMTEMESADGMEALNALMAKPYPFTEVKSTNYSSILKDIQKYLLPANYVELKSKEKSSAEVDRFDFDHWAGTYEWDAEHEMWVPDFGNPADKIIIHYPTEGSTTNNATLTIHTYEDTEITETDDYGTYTWYEPTHIVADLYVGDVKVVDITMNATWYTTGELAGEPSDMDVSVYLIPFEFTMDFNHAEYSAGVSAAILYENSQIFSAGLSALFGTGGMDDTPETISGYLQMLKVKIDASLNVKDIEEIMEAMESETPPYSTIEELVAAINGEFDAYVTVDGVKAADIELAYDETTQTLDLVFVYSDGSTESAQPYFSNFANSIDTFFSSLDNYYSNW